MPDDGILRVTVQARQRLALGVGSEVSFFTDSHAFVPGSVVRGALAAAWIAEHGPPGRGNGGTGRFRELFDGQIRFGPLYAAGSQIVPVSVGLCKYPADEECSLQAVDAAFETETRCPACGGPLEQGKGQVRLPPALFLERKYSVNTWDHASDPAADLHKLPGTPRDHRIFTLERITRTSIDPQTATAKKRELYAHAALPAGTIFHGLIHGRDPWLERTRPLRLGGRRTVGGAADYQAAPAEQSLPAEPLTASTTLTIRLTSPAIFIDAACRPRSAPDPADLDGAAVDQAWTRPSTMTGWHAASRLPKPEELCAVAGSVYRLSDPPETLRRLAGRLQREGLGLRRTEGFGDIEIVTGPWRPAAFDTGAARKPGGEAASLEWQRQIRDLALSASLRHWVVGALRELQLHRARHAAGTAAAGTAAADSLAGDLLARPAAGEFGGRQRELLRDLFAETDLGVLRDVTTLLAADLPPAGDSTE